MRTLVARHVKDVAEAPRGDHADPRAFALDDHVGRDRRAVKYRVDGARLDARKPADLEYALHHTFGMIVRRAGNLGDDYLAFGAVAGPLEHDVCECAADVDADPDHPRLHGKAAAW